MVSERKAFYITTTLPYVNDKPHIGFALELVQADALARYWRLLGHNVFFNTGTDEHGQKIWEAARERGEDVQAYVDRNAQSFQELCRALNISNDAFIRTTDPKHTAAAQELWRRCDAAGDIEKRTFKGLYCVGCEKLLTERDLENGRCPLHPNREPEEREEENYFFAFSRYEKQLLEYLEEGRVVPAYRLEEARQFVSRGLEDFSISRERERMSWGVPVPGDDSQVMYVWFDALANYISTLGWPDEKGDFKKFWVDGETLQVAGKDQVRFQSLMWQAMLLSAGIKPTDTVFYHGFLTSGGQKMSKSAGNGISPDELTERYGVDATRYLLLRHVHPTEDTDITWERLDEWYEAGLVNGLGNQVARILTLAEQHLDAPVDCSSEDVEQLFADAITSFKFQAGLDLLWEHIARADEYIQESQPFKRIKAEDEAEQQAARVDIEKLVRHVYKVAKHLEVVMPTAAQKIQEAVAENKKPENLFPRLS